jgi:hypothetical protein
MTGSEQARAKDETAKIMREKQAAGEWFHLHAKGLELTTW